MATTITASSLIGARIIGSPSRVARLGLLTLLMVALVAVQTTALAHEFEHVLHQHDAPCGLHVAADHLVIVSAPGPALGMLLVPSTDGAAFAIGHLPAPPARPSLARAPPLLFR
jgi:hypothetical protein